MAIAFVKNGGGAGVKTASGVGATVPAGGHAIGNTVVVVTVSPTGSPPVSVSDSRGNVWTRIDHNTAGQAAYIYASVLTLALLAADVITASWGATSQTYACIQTKEFSGLSITPDFSDIGVASGSSTAVSVGPLTPSSAAILLIGGLRVGGSTADTFSEDTDTNGGPAWAGVRAGTSGGAGTSNGYVNFAHKITTSAVAQTYDPTLGTARPWGATLAGLQPTAVPTPKLPRGQVYSQAVNRAVTWCKRNSGIVVPRLWTPVGV